MLNRPTIDKLYRVAVFTLMIAGASAFMVAYAFLSAGSMEAITAIAMRLARISPAAAALMVVSFSLAMGAVGLVVMHYLMRRLVDYKV